jgi:hypothetical protein
MKGDLCSFPDNTAHVDRHTAEMLNGATTQEITIYINIAENSSNPPAVSGVSSVVVPAEVIEGLVEVLVVAEIAGLLSLPPLPLHC